MPSVSAVKTLAAKAIESGRFKDEIVPVVIKGKKGDIVFDTDEHPRKSTPEAMAKLAPAFQERRQRNCRQCFRN